jgi:hypothetical protein
VNVLKLTTATAALLSAMFVAGCGEVSRNGRAPAQVVIVLLEGASGAEPDRFGSTLASDVVTIVERTINDETVGVPTIYSDIGRVTMRLVLKDPGVPGVAATPSPLNTITFNRYRVTYRRADGRNTPGVDVPFPFDSAATFTVPAESDATVGFTLVRITAKQEVPLIALTSSPVYIQTIADVTFYGQDQAGNEVSVSGNIGISFGNFGDPQ